MRRYKVGTLTEGTAKYYFIQDRETYETVSYTHLTVVADKSTARIKSKMPIPYTAARSAEPMTICRSVIPLEVLFTRKAPILLQEKRATPQDATADGMAISRFSDRNCRIISILLLPTAIKIPASFFRPRVQRTNRRVIKAAPMSAITSTAVSIMVWSEERGFEIKSKFSVSVE